MENLHDHDDLSSMIWMCKLPTVDGLDSPLMLCTSSRKTEHDSVTSACAPIDDENELGIINFDELNIDFEDLNVQNDVALVKEHIEKAKKPAVKAFDPSGLTEIAYPASASSNTTVQTKGLKNIHCEHLSDIDLTEDQEKELFMQAQTVIRLIKKKGSLITTGSKQAFLEGSTSFGLIPPDQLVNELPDSGPMRARSGTFTKEDNLKKSTHGTSGDPEKRQMSGTFVKDNEDLPLPDDMHVVIEAATDNDAALRRPRTGTFTKDQELLSELHTPVSSHTSNMSTSKLVVPPIKIDFSPVHSPKLPKDANGVIKFQGSLSTSPSAGGKDANHLRRSATFKKPHRPGLSKLQAPRMASGQSKELNSTDISPNKRQRTNSGSIIDNLDTISICSTECGAPVYGLSSGKRKIQLPKLRSSYSSSNLPKAKFGVNINNKHQRSRSNQSNASDVSDDSAQSSASSTASLSLNQSQLDSRNRQHGNLICKSSKASGLLAPKKKMNTIGGQSMNMMKLPSTTSFSQSVTCTATQADKPVAVASKKVSSVIPGMISKMSMLKPSNLQRRVLTANRNKQSKAIVTTTGPMKATGPTCIKPPNSNCTANPLNVLAVAQDKAADKQRKVEQKPSGLKRTGSFLKSLPKSSLNKSSVSVAKLVVVQAKKVSPPTSGAPLPSTCSTPVQKDKNMHPKRIFSGAGNTTPKKKGGEENCAEPGDKTPKRRSFLPTPTKKKPNKYEIDDGRCNSSSPSFCSIDSPVMTALPNPAIGILIDLNGLEDLSPSCMKSKPPRVVHTPMNKENDYQPEASQWSPISRPRLTREDQAFMCTKRTIPR